MENLKKLHFSLTNYLEVTLKLHHPLVTEELDLVSVAINADRPILIKLLQLTVLVLTNCEKKDIFITRIMKMNEVVQTHMMIFIRDAMERDDSPKNAVSEVAKLRKERRNLNAKVDKSQMQLELLMHSREAYEKQIEELKMRNLDLENELIRRVKMETVHPARDTLVASLEASIVQKDRQIANLTAQLEEERRIGESKLNALKDELDVANEHIGRLTGLESTLQKYKQKVEEFSDVKTKLRTVLDENEGLKKQLKSVKEQLDSSVVAAQQVTASREELSRTKAKAAKLDEDLRERDKQVKDLRLTNKDLEEKLQLSEIKCKAATDQLDKLIVGDTSSEDSFYARSPPVEESRHGRKNTLESLGFTELSGDTRDRRHREILGLTSELAQVKFIKTKLEEELQSLKTSSFTEIARLKAELTASFNLHAQETAAFTAKLQVLESELNAAGRRSNSEKADLLAKLQFTEMHFKQVDDNLKSLKKDKEDLVGEVRNLRKEKEDLTRRYLESREQEVKLVRELSERQVKYQAVEAERTMVMQKLEETTSALKLLDGKMAGESELNRSRSQIVTMERRIMQLEAESVELQVRNRQNDVKDKEEQLRKARVDQEQIKALQGEVTKWRHLSAQKDQDISYLARAKDELNRALSEERKLLFEVMQEMDTRLSDLNSSTTRERASKLFQSHI